MLRMIAVTPALLGAVEAARRRIVVSVHVALGATAGLIRVGSGSGRPRQRRHWGMVGVRGGREDRTRVRVGRRLVVGGVGERLTHWDLVVQGRRATHLYAPPREVAPVVRRRVFIFANLPLLNHLINYFSKRNLQPILRRTKRRAASEAS